MMFQALGANNIMATTITTPPAHLKLNGVELELPAGMELLLNADGSVAIRVREVPPPVCSSAPNQQDGLIPMLHVPSYWRPQSDYADQYRGS